MNECILTLLVMACQTPLTSGPAEAAAILAPRQFRPTVQHARPFRDVTPRRATPRGVHGRGPFGDFKPFPPRKRLDGTPYTMPPEILGLPAYHPYNMFRSYGVVIPQTEVVVLDQP